MGICVGAFDPDYTGMHKNGMEHDIPELLRSMMAAMDGGQVELARRLGGKISQPDVSRWMGGAEPKGKNFQRIMALAQELGVLKADLSSEDVAASLDKPAEQQVKLKGYVGAGSKAHFYAIADEDFTEVPAPAGASDKTIALEIRGKSWGPAMDSWLVFYDDVRSPITDDLIGHPCVVGLADDRILLKLVKSNGRGGFNLHSNSNTEEIISNAKIEWAAKVIGMRPR
jgi:hypothetical protein